jgi:class 3 adenylate cyclase
MNDSRTWLVSVLFLDIVGYSKVPVDQQLVIKLHFTGIVSQSLETLSQQDRIQLDTGDGCAISYFGDPEKLFPIATYLQRFFAGLQGNDPMSYQVRLGLNLGPVKVVGGISGDRNCVGAGINDAQRVMDFAGLNQLLVSKAYYDVVSSMSASYVSQLKYLGTRVDKHDKVHEVYQLNDSQTNSVSPGITTTMGFELDSEVKQLITREYAKYVGTSEAESSMDTILAKTSSLLMLCETLSKTLSEDDSYQFGVFTRYNGYSGY